MTKTIRVTDRQYELIVEAKKMLLAKGAERMPFPVTLEQAHLGEVVAIGTEALLFLLGGKDEDQRRSPH